MTTEMHELVRKHAKLYKDWKEGDPAQSIAERLKAFLKDMSDGDNVPYTFDILSGCATLAQYLLNEFYGYAMPIDILFTLNEDGLSQGKIIVDHVLRVITIIETDHQFYEFDVVDLQATIPAIRKVEPVRDQNYRNTVIKDILTLFSDVHGPNYNLTDMVVDLITDLHHYAIDMGLSWFEIIQKSNLHFIQEVDNKEEKLREMLEEISKEYHFNVSRLLDFFKGESYVHKN